MADNPTRDPAQADEPTAMLVGTPTGASAAAQHSTTAVMDGGPADPATDDLPVWSFSPSRTQGGLATPAIDRQQDELPLVHAEELVAAAPSGRPQPLFGPVGNPRAAVAVALLSAVTLGIYALVWHHRVNRELEEFDPKLHSRPARSTLAVMIPWLVGALVSIAGAVLIVAARLSVHVPFSSHVTTTEAYLLLAGLAAIPYLVLAMPFSVVAVVMTQERLRCVEEHVGVTTDRQVRPVRMSLLLALPLLGGLLLIGASQRRVNAIWDAVAPAGRLIS